MRLPILLMLAASCAPVDGVTVFVEHCNPAAGSGWYASHDFGTTDPATLARVVALETLAPDAGTCLDGNPCTALDAPLAFSGSVAETSCNTPDATVAFVLED